MKNDSRNKFFLCFRPLVDENFLFDPKDLDHHEKKKKKKKKSKNKDAIIKSSSPSSSENNKDTRKFGKVVKAILFETILGKKLRKRKSLKHSVSTDVDESVESEEDKYSPIFSSSSTSISSTTSSSPKIITFSPTVRKIDMKQQEQQHMMARKTSCTVPTSLNGGILSLLMMILALTVLLGKLNAIVLTTIWVYYNIPSCKGKVSEEAKSEIHVMTNYYSIRRKCGA
ncbi:hypothetical protein ACFE04_018931 [Oxalis oulophora]